MKKLTRYAAALALLYTVACSSDKSTETATVTTEEHGHGHDHEGMSHGDAVAQAPTLETPDFKSVAAPFKRNVSTMLDQYLQVKDALVASDAGKAKQAAGKVVEQANSLPVATLQAADQKDFAETQREKARTAAEGIANSTDIDTQRGHFEKLSEALYALTKSFGATDSKLYYQHCPMAQNDKGGSWLSRNKEIQNPYFGDKMMKCGSNIEELN